MAAVCPVGVQVGLKGWIVCWRMFLILCCFLLPSCGGCVCSWDSNGTSGVDCVLEDVSNTMLFLLPSVCCGCVCSGNSSETSGVDCIGGCFKNYAVFCSLVCVWRLCVQWGFKWD